MLPSATANRPITAPQALAQQLIGTGQSPAPATPTPPGPSPAMPAQSASITWSTAATGNQPAGPVAPPLQMAVNPPPAQPPPVRSLTTKGQSNSLPPISPVQPGEVALPDAAEPPPLKPPPSFQPADLANKSAANTSPGTSASSTKGQSAIAQKTKSFSAAVKAATLAKPVIAGFGEGGGIAVDDPDFGIYSHSEQVRQRHYYSRLTLNLFAVLFIGGMVISVWSFWPKLTGWWAGITTTDQQYFDNIIDNLLTTDIQKYQVELETTIGYFGRVDTADISGEFVIDQTDPADLGPSQSVIELDYDQQNPAANNPASYETIVIGVDQIHDPGNQSHYLRIRPQEVNRKQISQAELHRTWVKLADGEDLVGDSPAGLTLSLADYLTDGYDHYSYAGLLPSLSLSDPDQRDQIRDYLLANSLYHPFDCRLGDNDSLHLVTCQILVDTEKIYPFYQYVYQDVLETTVPERYQSLRLQSRLPNQLQLTIDTSRQQPVQLTTWLKRDVAGLETIDILTINYQLDSEDQIEIPAQPVEIETYRQQLEQFEADNQALFN